MNFRTHFLNSEELSYVVNSCMKFYPDVISMEIVKLGIVAQIVCDENELKEFDDCNAIYDYLLENNVDLYKEVSNMETVDKLLDKITSFDMQFNGFVNNVMAQIEALDVKGAVDELKEMINKRPGKTSKKKAE